MVKSILCQTIPYITLYFVIHCYTHTYILAVFINLFSTLNSHRLLPARSQTEPDAGWNQPGNPKGCPLDRGTGGSPVMLGTGRHWRANHGRAARATIFGRPGYLWDFL
jgi:hypothetical protein